MWFLRQVLTLPGRALYSVSDSPKAYESPWTSCSLDVVKYLRLHCKSRDASVHGNRPILKSCDRSYPAETTGFQLFQEADPAAAYGEGSAGSHLSSSRKRWIYQRSRGRSRARRFSSPLCSRCCISRNISSARFRSVMSTTTADGPQRIQISSSLRFGTKALKL